MATQAQRTQLVSGWFDCRIFRQGVAKENRPMKQDGDTINFTLSFAEYPQDFANFGGAEFIRRSEVNGLARYYVTIKIGRICAFFNKDGQKMKIEERPTNAMLDGKRFDAIIQYKVLHGDPAKMEPRGFWADAIQIKPAEEIVFAPMNVTAQPTATVNDAPTDVDVYV
jgi:hypothetical protein